MIESAPQPRARLLHEIVFAIYFPLLIVWTNAQTARIPWVVRLQLLIASYHRLHSPLDPELRLAIGLLWGLLAAIIFLCLRTLSRLSFTDFFLRTFAGMAAVAGFPLAYLYSYGYSAWVAPEVVAVVACAFLYLYRRWPLSAPWSISLLVVHFGLWTLVAWDSASRGPGLYLLWPGSDYWIWTRMHPDLIYPLLGLCSTLLWAAYVRHSWTSDQPGSPTIAG